MKTITRLMLSMLLLLGTTDMTAQTFKLSGDLREMLTEHVADSRRTSDSHSHMSLIMKVTNAADILARKYSYSTCNGIGATNHGSHVAGIATGSMPSARQTWLDAHSTIE